MTLRQGCFAIRKKLTRRQEGALLVLSFVLPLALWAAVSYTPFLYHPDMRITDAGDSLLCVTDEAAPTFYIAKHVTDDPAVGRDIGSLQSLWRASEQTPENGAEA